MTWMPKQGDRVRVKPGLGEGYKSPWDKRFERGLTGTIKSPNEGGRTVLVSWDVSPRAKYPSEWTFNAWVSDLERVE